MFTKTDYIYITEPLMEEVYKSPEQRLKALRKAHGTLGQNDPSSYVEVTLDNVEILLMEHRSTDVPTFNDFSLQDMRGYLLDGFRVFQYKLYWVPEKINLGKDEWLYVGKVADMKDVGYKLVVLYSLYGFLTSETFKVQKGYKRRRYIKNDKKLQYWNPTLKDFLLPRLLIAEEVLPNCETVEELYAAIEKYEEDNSLIIRGVKRFNESLTMEEFFSKFIPKCPGSIWGWRLHIKEWIRDERERTGNI